MTATNEKPSDVFGRIQREIQESIDVKTNLDSSVIATIGKMAAKIIECLKAEKQLIIFGNGGSAADAQHIAGELVGRYRAERKALRAMALGMNPAAFSAIANDYGFQEVFAREISAFGRSGDVALAISTSGSSVNVLKGLETARKLGLFTMGLSGRTGGKMLRLTDLCVCVPSDLTPRIQETHIMIGHIVCGIVEQAFVENATADQIQILVPYSSPR